MLSEDIELGHLTCFTINAVAVFSRQPVITVHEHGQIVCIHDAMEVQRPLTQGAPHLDSSISRPEGGRQWRGGRTGGLPSCRQQAGTRRKAGCRPQGKG